MAMWNPWRGCKKCSDGCLHCYIHKGDLKRNVDTFNESIMIFLVDNYFDEFVQSNKKLLEMYKGKDINLVDFITLFYKLLSENIGKDIITLNDAKSLVNKKYYEPNFIRSIKR